MKETLKLPELEAKATEQAVLKRVRALTIVRIWAVRIFFTALFAVVVIALIIPLRPIYSEAEKRELAKFPEFSFGEFLSGEYFADIDNWYSDTFPARDFFAELNAAVTNLFGFTDIQIHGEVEKGDDIPSVDTSVSSEAASSSENTSSDVASEEISSGDGVSSEKTESTSNDGVSNITPPPVIQPPPTETIGAILINGNTAYEYYTFNKAASERYAAAVNRAAALLEGKATVYDIIVPTSMGITAPESIVAGINTSDQKAAIDYMNSLIGANVKKVPIYEILKSKRDEYIYFRTDHHWTSLGAYYAYREFAEQKGVIPSELDSFITHRFDGFLGTFYSGSGKKPQLAATPDYVLAYEPKETNLLSIYSPKAVWYDTKIISDVSQVSAGNKYLTFIRGDNPICTITNPNLSDGSRCVVIKESFGNAFVPFLVSHYQTVYVVDYRHQPSVDPRGLVQFCQDTGATDVIFINNVSATRSNTLMAAIDGFVR